MVLTPSVMVPAALRCLHPAHEPLVVAPRAFTLFLCAPLHASKPTWVQGKQLASQTTGM
eukprot:NODE_32167_length_382_cov_0.976471.p4 GENE.NODE_32167_length_382_cov_0.976471~~NODE_32167_length_382_cov_0.976471.p4  ORF type:complete len:59 (+),score=3.48 NODE_32167_length_382_cov_0.976471:69-245(+)